MYYVYVLKDKITKELYYGYTNNLKRRIIEHNKIKNYELLYYEAYKSESDACNREKQLKRYAQALTNLKRRLKESLK
ncbi:MAG: GIY-YIG nuclease family protein [Candidatus Omnitrophota bacterium]